VYNSIAALAEDNIKDHRGRRDRFDCSLAETPRRLCCYVTVTVRHRYMSVAGGRPDDDGDTP